MRVKTKIKLSPSRTVSPEKAKRRSKPLEEPKQPTYLNSRKIVNLRDYTDHAPFFHMLYDDLARISNKMGMTGWEFTGCDTEMSDPWIVGFNFRKSFTAE